MNPVITFALFTHNQEQFIAEAVRGALNQTYSPLEIIISDDCSTDTTFSIIEKEIADYTGQHEIRLNRNVRNIGFAASINQVMNWAKGQLIVVASGDDVSLPDRVHKIYQLYRSSNGRALSLYSSAILIDEFGRTIEEHHASPDTRTLTLAWLSKHLGGVLGCSHAWDRRTFDVFGPMDETVIREDVVIPYRSALLGEIKFCDEPLVLYRSHSNNKWIGELERVRAPKDLRSMLLKFADGNIAIYKNRLRDLDAMFQLYPERQIQWNELILKASKSLCEMEEEKRLLVSNSTLQQLRVILRSSIRGTSLRKLIKWTLIAFFPKMYLSRTRSLKARESI